MANDGKLEKMEVDYSSTVDEKIPECERLTAAGKLNEAIDMLLTLEKQTRTGADAISTGRLLVAIVKNCFEAKKWELLNENLVLLTKRRGQLKQAVTNMVQEACTYVEKAPNLDTRLKLIDTLRTITAGKIYVEIERARLTRTLAQIREIEQNNISEACTIMQELQVETYGSMEKREKVEFILEQMRLCLAKKDYIRMQIISKKINTKFFDDPNTNELKLTYYNLMISLDQHEGSYLAISKHYRALYDTTSIQEDKEKKVEVLKCIVLYLVLAPFDNEQHDLINRLQQEKGLDEVPMYKSLLEQFLTSELMRWKTLVQTYEAELRSMQPGSAVFSQKTEEGGKRWGELKHRVVEHNIRVMSQYYTQVYMKRMAELLDLTTDETEDFLSKMVVAKTITAKMDRLSGIVHFQSEKNPTIILNDWSTNVNSLMQLVNKTTHLITKEEMVHKFAV